MTYPFPEIDSTHIYARTFLQDVTVSLWFNPQLTTDDANKRFADFSKQTFGLKDKNDKELKGYGDEGTPKIESSDGTVSFVFYIDSIVLRVKYPVYKQFDSIIPFIPIVEKYLSLLEVLEIKQMRISKFNEIKYNYQSDSISINQAMRGIFSNTIMGWNDFKNPDFSNVARWERKIVFNDDASNTNSIITYGFSQNESDTRKGVLTLRISVDTYDINDMSCLEEGLKKCNHIADSAFQWSVSSSILKEMERNE